MHDRDAPTEGNGGESETEALDVTFRALAHEHRRGAVRHLSRAGEATTLEDLVRSVAAEEAKPDEPGSGEVVGVDRDLLLQFHHAHLPVLLEAGIAEYDPETGVVRPGRDVEPLASAIDEIEAATER